ncbi:DsrE family protein [Micrococcus terreus]|uniref:DsrE family protein n=1 Tax=Micrococcus terreus TaxID=574650 RepID=UPI00254E4B12|nr:DsrE family protein [Micrococcus terreus]MDK7701439.1 DsrE family protein [Micrococcus terreus]WOO98140.1 DsrE family protein [Micrococcus terreus]
MTSSPTTAAAPRAAITLTTGLEDAEKVTVAFLVAVGAAESGRSTLMFLTKESVRLAVSGFPRSVACDGCPPLVDLMQRYADAGGTYIACGICVKSKGIDPTTLVENARVAGTVQLWEWIGERSAPVTFSF